MSGSRIFTPQEMLANIPLMVTVAPRNHSTLSILTTIIHEDHEDREAI